MSDYPKSYDDAKDLDDAETWIKGREAEEIEEELDNLHAYQLEWLGYVCEDKEKETLLRDELEKRDADEIYGIYGTPESVDEDEEDEVIFGEDDSTSSGGTADVWDSGLETLENFEDLAEHLIGARSLEQYAKQELGIEKNKVIVPEEVRKICKALQNEVNGDYGGHCEFGVLFKGEWTDEGFKVKPDYVVPEQKASRAHITYKEDLKEYRDEGYIVNVHSHPWAGQSASFSGTDDDHINSHFDMAILYAGKAETLVDARANVEVEDGMNARIKPEVEVQTPEEELPDVDSGNVETGQRMSKRKTSGTKRDWKSKSKRNSSLVSYGGHKGTPHGNGYRSGYDEDKKDDDHEVWDEIN